MKRLLPAALLALSPGLAGAASEVYGGIGGGFSLLDVSDAPLLIENVAIVAQEFSGSDFSARAFAGFRYGRFIGIEAGYIDFGTINDDVPALTPQGETRTPVGAKVDGWEAYLVGHYPLNQDLTVLGRIGFAGWDYEQEIAGGEFSFKDDGTDLAYGLGMRYRATPRVGLRLDLSYYDVDFADDLWTVTASVTYGWTFDR